MKSLQFRYDGRPYGGNIYECRRIFRLSRVSAQPRPQALSPLPPRKSMETRLAYAQTNDNRKCVCLLAGSNGSCFLIPISQWFVGDASTQLLFPKRGCPQETLSVLRKVLVRLKCEKQPLLMSACQKRAKNVCFVVRMFFILKITLILRSTSI